MEFFSSVHVFVFIHVIEFFQINDLTNFIE